MRDNDDIETVRLEPKIEEPKKETKRKSAPQEKAGISQAAAAKRKSAPASAGLRTAEPATASAGSGKHAKDRGTSEAPDTALPLSERLQSHKRTRSSSDGEDAMTDRTEQEPAKKKKKGRPASAPSGMRPLTEVSAPHQSGACTCSSFARDTMYDLLLLTCACKPVSLVSPFCACNSPGSANGTAAATATAQDKPAQAKGGRSRKSAPAALKPSAAETAAQLPKQADQKGAAKPAIISGKDIKQQKHSEKQGQPASDKHAAATGRDASAETKTRPGCASSKEVPAAAETVKPKSGSNRRNSKEESSERPGAASSRAAAALDKTTKKSSSGRSEGADAGTKSAAAAASKAMVTTAKSAPDKGKQAAAKAADAAADTQKAAAAAAANQSKKVKGRAAAAAAAAGSSAAAAKGKAKDQAAAAETADARQAAEGGKLPAAPLTPAGTSATADVAAAPAAAIATAGISSDGTSEFAKLQVREQLYSPHLETKSRKLACVTSTLLQETAPGISKQRSLCCGWGVRLSGMSPADT